LKPRVEGRNILLVRLILHSVHVVDVGEKLVRLEPVRVVERIVPVRCERHVILQLPCFPLEQLGEQVIEPRAGVIGAEGVEVGHAKHASVR
jgi:hypothetical protein